MNTWELHWKGITVIVALIVALPWFLKGYPRAKAILDETPSPQILPHPNAFDDFEAAGHMIVRESDIEKAFSPHSSSLQSQSPQWTISKKQSLVKANHSALARIKANLKRPFVEPDINPLKEGYRLMKSRELARLLALEGEIRLAEDDSSGAARSNLDAVRMGAKVESASDMIGMLVGVACQTIGRREMRKSLGRLDANTARSLGHELETADDAILSFLDILKGEERYAFTVFRYNYQHPEQYSRFADSDDGKRKRR